MELLVILVCQHGGLTDRDKLNALSTCKTFHALLNKVQFTELHNYNSIKHTSYLDSFTTIIHTVYINISWIDTRITHIKYLMNEPITYIPTSVTHVLFSMVIPRTEMIRCPIPENVVSLVLEYFPEKLDLQDGNTIKTVTLEYFTGDGYKTQTFMRDASKKPIQVHYESRIPIQFWYTDARAQFIAYNPHL